MFESTRVDSGFESHVAVEVDIEAAAAATALKNDPPVMDTFSSQQLPPKSSSNTSNLTVVGLQSSSSSLSLPGMPFTPVAIDAILMSVGDENMLCPEALSRAPTATFGFGDGYSAFGLIGHDREFTIM